MASAWSCARAARLPQLRAARTRAHRLDARAAVRPAHVRAPGRCRASQAPLFPPEKVAASDWDAIEANAVKVMEKVRAVGPKLKH